MYKNKTEKQRRDFAFEMGMRRYVERCNEAAKTIANQDAYDRRAEMLKRSELTKYVARQPLGELKHVIIHRSKDIIDPNRYESSRS